MDLNDEMVEMMKFYEFYKKIKASEEKDKLTNKNNELFKKTFEETGIKINKLKLNWATTLSKPVIKNNRKINIVSISYYSTDFDTDEFNMDSREFEVYDWLTLEEIEKLEITEYSKIALEMFKKEHLSNFLK